MRKKWRQFISSFHPSRYVWIDESHIDRKVLARRYGRTIKKGDPLISATQQLSFESYSLICCMNFEKVMYWKTIPTHQIGVNGEEFMEYMEELKSLFQLILF